MKYITRAKQPTLSDVNAPIWQVNADGSERITNAMKPSTDGSILGKLYESNAEYSNIEGIILKAVVTLPDDETVTNVVIPKATTSTGYVVEICDDTNQHNPLGVYANIYKGVIKFYMLD